TTRDRDRNRDRADQRNGPSTHREAVLPRLLELRPVAPRRAALARDRAEVRRVAPLEPVLYARLHHALVPVRALSFVLVAAVLVAVEPDELRSVLLDLG